MDAKPQRLKGQEDAISTLKAAIDASNLAEKTSNITPAKAVFGPVSTLLATIRVCFLSSATIRPGFTRN